jgi:hypothetical protein
MAFKIIVGILATILSSVLYRAGGYGKPFKTWIRDWLIPLILYSTIAFICVPKHLLGYICLTVAILPTGGALTSYWDFLFKGKDNFYFHGFMIGLGAFPLYWYGSHWYFILLRAILLAISFGLLNWYVNKKAVPHSDDIEEFSRGALIALTIPLLLI